MDQWRWLGYNDKQISLHSGELAAINYLTAMIDYDSHLE